MTKPPERALSKQQLMGTGLTLLMLIYRRLMTYQRLMKQALKVGTVSALIKYAAKN